MAIDTGPFISDIDIKLPADSDNRSEGAGQIRALKSALKRTFRWLDGEDNKRPNLPLGSVIMYAGSEENLEPGWAICDGRVVNEITTPDLRGRFIMGSGTYTVKKKVSGAIQDVAETVNTGGSGGEHYTNSNVDGTVLTIDQMPSHNHGGSTVGAGAHSHTMTITERYDQERGQYDGPEYRDRMLNTRNYSTNSVGNHTHGIPAQGSNQAHTHGQTNQENRPLYYALAYIMFVGMSEV